MLSLKFCNDEVCKVVFGVSMVSLHGEENDHVYEDKRKGKAQKVDTRNLLLWRETMVIRCFVWPLALQAVR